MPPGKHSRSQNCLDPPATLEKRHDKKMPSLSNNQLIHSSIDVSPWRLDPRDDPRPPKFKERRTLGEPFADNMRAVIKNNFSKVHDNTMSEESCHH